MEPDLYVLAPVVQNWIFDQEDRSFVVHAKHWWIAFFSDEFFHQSRKPDPLCCCRRVRVHAMLRGTSLEL